MNTTVIDCLIRSWDGGWWRFLPSLIALSLSSKSTCHFILVYTDLLYRMYITYLLRLFLFAEDNALPVAPINYVFSAENRTCISALLDGMLKWKEEHISMHAIQHRCCTDPVSHGAETFGETVISPYNVTNILFVFVSCFIYSFHGY